LLFLFHVYEILRFGDMSGREPLNGDQPTPLLEGSAARPRSDNGAMFPPPQTLATRLATPCLLALLPACLSASAWAQSDALQIYARLNVGLEAMHRDAADGARHNMRRLSNYRSVLGLRGNEALGAGTRLLFQVEGTLSPDTGRRHRGARHPHRSRRNVGHAIRRQLDHAVQLGHIKPGSVLPDHRRLHEHHGQRFGLECRQPDRHRLVRPPPEEQPALLDAGLARRVAAPGPRLQ
jgi:hypothetical protein